jgi:hypothetical protein
VTALKSSKSSAQIGRAATTLGIGVAGLVIVRLIVENLPMFKDAGWIVKGKLDCFAKIPAMGTMAASLVFLICTGIAYTDFKLLTNAWPSIKQLYIWSFFTLAAALLVQITFLLYQNRDRIAALILRQPIPAQPLEKRSDADTRSVLAVR